MQHCQRPRAASPESQKLLFNNVESQKPSCNNRQRTTNPLLNLVPLYFDQTSPGSQKPSCNVTRGPTTLVRCPTCGESTQPSAASENLAHTPEYFESPLKSEGGVPKLRGLLGESACVELRWSALSRGMVRGPRGRQKLPKRCILLHTPYNFETPPSVEGKALLFLLERFQNCRVCVKEYRFWKTFAERAGPRTIPRLLVAHR